VFFFTSWVGLPTDYFTGSNLQISSILVAEDCPVSSQILERFLERMGHGVARCVASGEEAVASARELSPDLVLMDINLAGGMSGLEAAKRIIDELDIPVILVTAEDDEATLDGASRSEAAGFIKKPVDLEELRVVLALARYRHEMVRRVKQSEAKYRNIFDNAVVGIYCCHPDGHYLDCNAAFAEMLGYSSREELIGAVKNNKDQVYVDPQRGEQLLKAIVEGCGKVNDFESEVYGRDGDVLWISEFCQGVRDHEGRLAYYEGIVLNITARKEAEEAYQTSVELLQRTIDAVPDIIFLLDLEKNIILCNQAFTQAYHISRDEAVGRRCQDVVHKGEPAGFSCPFEEFLRDQREVSAWTPGVGPGSMTYLSISPFFDAKGKCIGAVHVLRRAELPACGEQQGPCGRISPCASINS